MFGLSENTDGTSAQLLVAPLTSSCPGFQSYGVAGAAEQRFEIDSELKSSVGAGVQSNRDGEELRDLESKR